MGSWVLLQARMAKMKWTQWRWVKSRRSSNWEAGELFGSSMWSENPSQGWQDVWGGEKESVPSLQWRLPAREQVYGHLQEPQKIRGFYLRTVEEQWPGNFIGCKVSLEGVGLGPGSLCFRRNPNSSGQHPWHIVCVSKLGHENHLRVCVKNIDFRAPSWVHWIRIYRRGDWECIF